MKNKTEVEAEEQTQSSFQVLEIAKPNHGEQTRKYLEILEQNKNFYGNNFLKKLKFDFKDRSAKRANIWSIFSKKFQSKLKIL